MANTWIADKPWTHMKVEHAQGSGTTHFYLANIGAMGHGSKVRESILGFPLKLFEEKCPAGMTYHPKEEKLSWNH